MNFTALTATVQPNLDVNYIGMDVHSDNVVVCVRRNTINSSGQLVGKTIKTKKVVIKSSRNRWWSCSASTPTASSTL